MIKKIFTYQNLVIAFLLVYVVTTVYTFINPVKPAQVDKAALQQMNERVQELHDANTILLEGIEGLHQYVQVLERRDSLLEGKMNETVKALDKTKQQTHENLSRISQYSAADIQRAYAELKDE